MMQKKQILQNNNKAKQLEERMQISDQDLLMSDVHILKFCTGKGDYSIILIAIIIIIILLVLLLLLYYYLLQELTEIPSGKNEVGVCQSLVCQKREFAVRLSSCEV